jgi:hypothetical protein
MSHPHLLGYAFGLSFRFRTKMRFVRFWLDLPLRFSSDAQTLSCLEALETLSLS